MSRIGVILRNKDVLSGLVFIAIALTFYYGASRLQMGTTTRMGPGYFPVVLCGLLGAFGIITAVNGLRRLVPELAVEPLAWSRLAIIISAVLFFTFGLGGLGLPLTVFGTTLISASASREFRLLPSLAVSAAAAGVAWVAFRMLLGLPFQAVGSWLQFG